VQTAFFDKEGCVVRDSDIPYSQHWHNRLPCVKMMDYS